MIKVLSNFAGQTLILVQVTVVFDGVNVNYIGSLV